jgi:hydroxymethylpyrimidine/phosphomethylpyrimidine kinase
MKRILSIAGSDSGGGAGLQADIKTITCFGCYGATAVTAITVQNTLGVSTIVPIDPLVVHAQIQSVLGDIGADCIKIGMVYDAKIIQAVADALSSYGHIPLVLDTVMVAKGGASLLADTAITTLKELLVPKATLVTPNIPEAIALGGHESLHRQGAMAVLLKGGHDIHDIVTDTLYINGTTIRYTHPRIKTRNLHGTGCTLASAIACGLAHQLSIEMAVEQGIAYVQQAIAKAPDIGQGHGPLYHAVMKR